MSLCTIQGFHSSCQVQILTLDIHAYEIAKTMNMAQLNLFECVFSRWYPGINDPFLTSWIMVVVYLLVAACAFVVAKRAVFPDFTRNRERVFWGLITVVMIVMAINKQLDLQSLLPATGRCLSEAQGWFEHRRLVQRVFFLVLILLAAGGTAILLWRLRHALKRSSAPLLGLVLMAGFVLSRAAEFNHIDSDIGTFLTSRWGARVSELAGPLVILFAGLVRLRDEQSNDV